MGACTECCTFRTELADLKNLLQESISTVLQRFDEQSLRVNCIFDSICQRGDGAPADTAGGNFLSTPLDSELNLPNTEQNSGLGGQFDMNVCVKLEPFDEAFQYGRYGQQMTGVTVDDICDDLSEIVDDDSLEAGEKFNSRKRQRLCPVCWNRVDSSKFDRHMLSHNDPHGKAFSPSKQGGSFLNSSGGKRCQYCSLVFGNEGALTRHMRSRHSKSYSSQRTIQRSDHSPHTGTALEISNANAHRYIRCRICHTLVYGKRALECHMAAKHHATAFGVHHKRIKCTICSLEVSDLRKHMVVHHSEPGGLGANKQAGLRRASGNFKCTKCAVVLWNARGLERHMRVRHGSSNSRARAAACVCKVCSLEVANPRNLRKHMQQYHHAASEESRNEDTISSGSEAAEEEDSASVVTFTIEPCPICRVYFRSSNMERHMRTRHAVAKTAPVKIQGLDETDSENEGDGKGDHALAPDSIQPTASSTVVIDPDLEAELPVDKSTSLAEPLEVQSAANTNQRPRRVMKKPPARLIELSGSKHYLRCRICKTLLFSERSLKSHMLAMHGVGKDNDSKGGCAPGYKTKRYVCPICSVEVTKLSRHLAAWHSSSSRKDNAIAVAKGDASPKTKTKHNVSVDVSEPGVSKAKSPLKVFDSKAVLHTNDESASKQSVCEAATQTGRASSVGRAPRDSSEFTSEKKTPRAVAAVKVAAQAKSPDGTAVTKSSFKKSNSVKTASARNLVENMYMACPVCRLKIRTCHLQRHVQAKHAGHALLCRLCPVCNKLMSTSAILRRHLRRQHPDYDVKATTVVRTNDEEQNECGEKRRRKTSTRPDEDEAGRSEDGPIALESANGVCIEIAAEEEITDCGQASTSEMESESEEFPGEHALDEEDSTYLRWAFERHMHKLLSSREDASTIPQTSTTGDNEPEEMLSEEDVCPVILNAPELEVELVGEDWSWGIEETVVNGNEELLTSESEGERLRQGNCWNDNV